MAKKRTISDLLGSSDGRVQADLNLPKVSLQPSINRAGTYGVGTVKTGDNELLRLADALGKINPIIKDYRQEKLLKEETYITEAQAGVQEFKNKWDAAGSKEERDQMLKDLRDSKNKTERELDKQFRDDFNANFLATQRIRKLIGDESVAEGKAYIADQIKQFKMKNIEKFGELPSMEQTQQFLAELPDRFLQGENAPDMSDPFVKQGFMEGLKPTMDNYAETLYDDFSEHAKANVYIPKKANQIRHILLDDSGKTRAEKVEAIKTIYQEGDMMLSMTDQASLLEKVVKGIAPEDLDTAEEMMDILGELKIGNQKFADKEDSFIPLLDTLEDNFKKHESELREDAARQVNEQITKLENEITVDIFEKGKTVAELDEQITEEITKVRDNTEITAYEKELKLSKLIQIRESLNTRVERAKDEVEALATGADDSFFFKGFESVVQEGVLKYRNAGGTADVTEMSIMTETFSSATGQMEYELTPEGTAMFGDIMTEYTSSRDKLIEDSLSQKTADGDMMNNKQRAAWLTAEVKKLNEETNKKVRERTVSHFEKTQDTQEQAQAQQEAEEEKKAREKTLAGVSARTTKQKGRTRVFGTDILQGYDAFEDDHAQLVEIGTEVVNRGDDQLNEAYIIDYTKQKKKADRMAALLVDRLNKPAMRARGERNLDANLYAKRHTEAYSDGVRFQTFKADDVLEMIKSGKGNETYVHVIDGKPNGMHLERDFFKSPIYIEGLTADSEAAKALADEIGISVDEVMKNQEEIAKIRGLVE